MTKSFGVGPILAGLWLVTACAPTPPSVEEHLAKTRVDPAALAAGDAATGDERVVAEFEGGRLTVADVRRWTEGWTEFDRIRYQSADRKRELVQELVALELLAREALTAGYDQRPDVLALLKREVARRYLDDKVAARVTLRDVSDADVQAYYDTHRVEYLVPETRRLRHLVVAREGLARQARSELDTALPADDPVAGLAAWERIGEQYNEDRETRALGGDLGWVDAAGHVRGTVRDARVCEALAAAVFAVEGGWGVAGPVLCEPKWELGLVTEVRPARQQPLEEVTSRIRNRLLQERREVAKRALIDQLRSRAGVKLDEAALKALEPAAEPGTTPRVRLPSIHRLSASPSALPMLRPTVPTKARALDEATRKKLIEEQTGRMHR